LDRLRRRGPQEATRLVAGLIRNKQYPLVCAYRFIWRLMKRGEFDCAGTLFRAIRRAGVRHPMIDTLWGKWLWCMDAENAAFAFAERKARFWRKSYLFELLATMCTLNGQRERSQKYLGIACMLADYEIVHETARSARRPSPDAALKLPRGRARQRE